METLPTHVDETDAPGERDLDDRLELPVSIQPAPFWRDDETLERVRRYGRWAIDGFVVGAVVLFVLVQLGPGNLIANNTPAGGDMGAHVWGPAYLRDHLLPNFQLTGWTPDWYDGFPAYQFYMVVPALVIVAVNAGLRGWAALAPLFVAAGLILGPLLAGRRTRIPWQPVAIAAAIAAPVLAGVYHRLGYRWIVAFEVIAVAVVTLGFGVLSAMALRRLSHGEPKPWLRRLLISAGALVAVFGIGFPYGVAFKFVSVAGVLAIPIAAYAFGRLADLPFPTPALLSAVTLIFLFNREPIANGTGNIIGGNVTSTLAGEFSFTLSLALAILYLGVLVAGLRTGRYRGLGAVLIGLTVLCHLIPGIFAIGATLCALAVWPGRRRLQWLATVLPVGGLLTAFWTLPFVGRHQYVNDMGWEKSPPNIQKFGLWEILTNRPDDDALSGQLNEVRKRVYEDYLVPNGMKVFLVLALVGLIVSIVLRIRVGLWLALTTVVLAFGFLVAPESRLWNARLLPFYYLCICLLAVIGVAELVRSVALLTSTNPARPVFAINAAAPVAVLGVFLVVVGLPLNSIGTTDTANNEFDWWLFTSGADANPARGWAQWNYSGYEGKPTYAEYYALVQTMTDVGADHGCGRAMWEYDGDRLNGYGTPMAPMLLPYWTDGCIGSMEGLYFEASMTTPFHFINQRELSSACSCAQRNLPYSSALDLDLGVQHLQLLGVRYYLAATEAAVKAADAHRDLTPIAVSGPWHVYEVDDAELVEPLGNQPAVVTDENEGIDWIYGKSNPHTPVKDHPTAEGPAMDWYRDPSRWDVFLATSGPDEWQRVGADERPADRSVRKATVSNVRTDNDSIAFDVDRTGTPILVKASYFPNWEVEGAEGPYRVAPNLMVVVPTSNQVRLHYGQTGVEYLAYGLTLVGIALLVLLARRPALSMPEPKPSSEAVLARFLEGNYHDSHPEDDGVEPPPPDEPDEPHGPPPPPAPPL